jgi:adenine-specific DNA-methyltransferase
MAKKAPKTVEALKHGDDKRKNIPTAEHQSVLAANDLQPRPVRYPRNTDLDPQLVWRGKDEQDWSDLVVPAPPLYIQEKVHPKALIDDLLRQSRAKAAEKPQEQPDRLTIARDLLTDSGSIFVQIGDENVHRVRALMDEVFGDKNFVETISYRTKNMTLGGRFLEGVCDTILWYARSIDALKYRRLFGETDTQGDSHWNQVVLEDGTQQKLDASQIADRRLHPSGARIYQLAALYPTGSFATGVYTFLFRGKRYDPPAGRSWKSPIQGMRRLDAANRIEPYSGGVTIRYRLMLDDYPVSPIHNIWLDTAPPADKQYVVQTGSKAVQRCLLMATDPGDLVLDPTCGSGTTAFVAEQWGRRWITIDTSRVALALARTRIMGARYPFFLLADSRDGQVKEAEVTRTAPSSQPVHGNVRHGFVYERVPHITLKSIANNAEIDVIWNKWQETLEPLREKLNAALKRSWQEWEIPREADAKWPDPATKLHADWWKARISRQQEIDKSIAAKAEFEYLYDKPYEDRKKVRVAGPFTVESLSPHRVLGVDENDELIDGTRERGDASPTQSFPQMILDNLRTAGVQQAHKEDRITFVSLLPWPGDLVCGEGRYLEGTTERRAAIFIGPEFGTVQRADLVAAAREAGDAGFDVLVACAFSYEAHATGFDKLGRMAVLKARMNADLHMAGDLKNTGKGNLFVIFGEPDIDLLPEPDGRLRVKVKGVDVFHPQTGEVRSDGPDGIACWFIDTDYNEESFFVRHAYFLGANDPYSALKTTLKAEIDPDAWATLNSDTSRPFDTPASGRIAVKIINHLGDEVMKVFRV